MASACLEVWQPSGRIVVTLLDERVTVGKAETNSVVFTHDLTVSRRHAVLENLGLCWTIRDLGSRNGTYLNGRRITGECALNHRDELRVGNCRLVYLDEALADEPGYATQGSEPSPDLTPRERDVVAALCRPLFAGDPSPSPLRRARSRTPSTSPRAR